MFRRKIFIIAASMFVTALGLAEETPQQLKAKSNELRAQIVSLKAKGNEAKAQIANVIIQVEKLDARAKMIQSEPAVKKALSSLNAVKPNQTRKLLIYTRTTGYRHKSISLGAAVLKRIGDETGAYSATLSDEPAMMSSENLAIYDAVLMLSTVGKPIDKKYRAGFEEFLGQGKGLIGIHAATDCHKSGWPGYPEAMGGIFDGHPWGSGSTVTINNEDVTHTCADSIPQGFTIKDEMYQYKENKYYSRNKLRILLSLDLEGKDMMKNGMKRKDNDYPVSWVHSYGTARVFYSNFGHNESTFFNAEVLQHFLSGIQFALGDLEADTTPSAKRNK